MHAIRASRASQRGHAALRVLVCLCAGRLTPVVVVVAVGADEALTRHWHSAGEEVLERLHLTPGTLGRALGRLGAADRNRDGLRESRNMLEEVKGVIVPALPHLCCPVCCWSKAGLGTMSWDSPTCANDTGT